MNRAVPLLMGVAFALSGCISLGEKPPESLMTLHADTPLPADSAGVARSGATIVVLTPTQPTALANDRVAVRTGDTSIAYLEKARWSDLPARLFGDLLSETIAARTGRAVVDRREFALAPGARLMGRLTAFELDTTLGAVVVSYDASLAPGEGRPLLTRRFEARVPTVSEKAPDVARALNAAANKVAVDVADWVGK